jgi:hypothetical protein
MRTITQEELNKIIEQHQHWIKEDCEGWEDMRANLEGADIKCANLEGANLKGAYLEGAYLKGADIKCANLEGAYLKGAYLEGAYLNGAYLKGAYLEGADLNGANLEGANLKGAYLEGADLKGAYLEGADLKGADIKCANLKGADFRLGKILTEPLTGYKKTNEGVVITAEIPKGAIVFCINGNKCRTNRAKITDMAGKELLHSSYNTDFEYRLGQEIEIENFNLMYNVECADGFHFFRTREEAENYNG